MEIETSSAYVTCSTLCSVFSSILCSSNGSIYPLVVGDGAVGDGDSVELLLDAHGDHQDLFLREERLEPVTRGRVGNYNKTIS